MIGNMWMEEHNVSYVPWGREAVKLLDLYRIDHRWGDYLHLILWSLDWLREHDHP